MIYIECYADHALLTSLIKISRKQIDHEFRGGRGSVCNRMAKTSGCLGMVDEDPSSAQPRYIAEARIVEDLPEQGLRILHHTSGNNYIVLLRPRLEDWILAAAREVGLDVEKYSLPDNARKLHSIINLNLEKFERLLGQLYDSQRLKKLKSILKKYYPED